VDRWRASFEIDPEHADALVRALEVPNERLDLVTGTMDDDRPFATVAFTVAATNAEEARARAREDISRAVELAGLPERLIPGPADGALISPVAATPLHEQLATEANRLVMEGQYDAAVLRAQAACEVYAEQVLEDVAVRRGGERLFKLIKPRTFSLSDDRTIALFFLITGEWIDSEPWWSDYARHVKRRHLIVHAGGVVSEDEADHSLEAAQAFRDYLRAAWARFLGTEIDPRAR
jgi:hypothetical protein